VLVDALMIGGGVEEDRPTFRGFCVFGLPDRRAR
jgi:hypothetical protein